jgi:anthranilate phosphoribosyltransferase
LWLLPMPARQDEPQTGGGLRAILLRLMRGESLARAEASSLLEALLDGEATDAQIAAALVALSVKVETLKVLA